MQCISTLACLQDFNVFISRLAREPSNASTLSRGLWVYTAQPEEEEGEGEGGDGSDFLLRDDGNDIDLRLARLEHLMSRRPELLSSVVLRQNPHNVAEVRDGVWAGGGAVIALLCRCVLGTRALGWLVAA